MSVQSSITEFFATRKRPAIDDAKRSSQPSKKVMILENDEGDVSVRKISDQRRNSAKNPSARRRLIYPNSVVSASEANVTKKKVLKRVLFDKKISSSPQSDIRKTFGVLNGKSNSTSSTLKTKETSENSKNEVVIGKTEFVTCTAETTEVKENPVEQIVEENLTVEVAEPPTEIVQVESSVVETSSVGDEKSVDGDKSSGSKENAPVAKSVPVVEGSKTPSATALKKSSRIKDLTKLQAKLRDGYAKLDKIQKEKKVQLDRFDMITFETSIPSPSKKTPIKMGMSPAKLREAAFGSPGGGRRRLDMDSSAAPPAFVSPRKLLEAVPPPSPRQQPPASPLKSPLKSPAFQRYQALVSEGKSALTLPFKYRSLAEVFRAIETVVSMLEKRQESTTFTKLKTSVQELLRRNLFEKHLAQIKAVNDAFYTFHYEKVHSVGANKLQPDRYELVVKPVLAAHQMSPDVLLERRRQFYACLLERTKTHHEAFLAALDPPLVVARQSLTRWHPEFDIDAVPDIEAAALPLPPSAAKVSTARDVLEKARNLFTSNPRMERALQRVSEQSALAAVTATNGSGNTAPVATSNGNTEPAATNGGNTAPAVAALTTALKGIPKSLLEKVRYLPLLFVNS
ncbi:DNA replication factor Cdt1-like [Nilaparvata lugens]|uniref:DNA replication factor Cdt1-like n=1 Tax=Nilaparvata lugens TaxID=108931 RepID=UPI00193CF026|nr:DNA replication factor Cdt1-like [Nilaparvata lugens]